jgi:hypothetical protein
LERKEKKQKSKRKEKITKLDNEKNGKEMMNRSKRNIRIKAMVKANKSLGPSLFRATYKN